MRWTEQAKTAARRTLARVDGDTADAATAYAEQLAEYDGSTFVDMDLWRRSWAVVSRARRNRRHAETRDAS